MIDLLAAYQGKLETLGLDGLGLVPIRHPTGRRFAGSVACAECHQEAYDVWKDTGHATGLTTLEEQRPRRDSDPECLSCHVVGWAPQRYEPVEGGFAGMQVTPHLAHQGCENCHGPAAAHAAVERGDVRASVTERDRLRGELAMSIKTPEGKQKAVNNCLECHDGKSNPHLTNLSTYESMKAVLDRDTGANIFTLVRVSHIHLFGVTFIFFLMGLIFGHAYVRPVWLKCTLMALPFACIATDISSWYMVKLFHPFAYLTMAAGGLMALCFTAMWFIAMYQLWIGKAPAVVMERRGVVDTLVG
jgi:hypothetical protein